MTAEWFITILLPFLYTSIAIIAFIGYLPQIITLITSKTDCRDVSLLTWFIWLPTWIIQLCYGWIILADWRLCFIACVNITAHMAIIGLVMFNRYIRHKPQPTSKQAT